MRAIERRDWDGATACCAADLVEHDHRALAVLGTTRGAEAWVRNLRTQVELAPDTRFRTRRFRAGARGFLTWGGWQGSREGGDYEIPLVIAVALDEAGRFARAGLFDPEQIEAAEARLREIEAGAAPAPPRRGAPGGSST